MESIKQITLKFLLVVLASNSSF